MSAVPPNGDDFMVELAYIFSRGLQIVGEQLRAAARPEDEPDPYPPQENDQTDADPAPFKRRLRLSQPKPIQPENQGGPSVAGGHG